MDSLEYDLFISYARADDADGWVTGLRDAIYDDFRAFSPEPFRIFFDQSEIHGRQDWELRLRQGLRTSRVLLICVSPNYLRSEYCRWEWDEFARMQNRRSASGDTVAGVYFVELGDQAQYRDELLAFRRSVERIQLEKFQPWFPNGSRALEKDEVRERVKALGFGVHEQLTRARRAKAAPGNLRRFNPSFVGRVDELHSLRTYLSGDVVGTVTAVHGLGGMGKTELTLTYAHANADRYQAGTWQVDADGHTSVSEAVSALALTPELGLDVREEHLRDRKWLGRLVFARLAELAYQARETDPGNASCLLLLDNVSEPELLAAAELAQLPRESWLHVVATTRLGVGDIDAVGARSHVALMEVGPLGTEAAVELIREHQPARDADRLRHDFSRPDEELAARTIVELVGGYTLAVEQAAVYLGVSGREPSQLLGLLRSEGTSVLDAIGESREAAQLILHEERLVGRIADQTVADLPERARDALSFASLLPPDTIPWAWLRELSDVGTGGRRLPGLTYGADWPVALRMIEGRRLITQADAPNFGRMHRVLGEHFSRVLVTPGTHVRLDEFLVGVTDELSAAAIPDPGSLSVATECVTGRLLQGHSGLAFAGLELVNLARSRMAFTPTYALAAATLRTFEDLFSAAPEDQTVTDGLASTAVQVGDLLALRLDLGAAVQHHTLALELRRQLLDAAPHSAPFARNVAASLNHVGNLMKLRNSRGDDALVLHTSAAEIAEQLVADHPDDLDYQFVLATSVKQLGDERRRRDDDQGALESYQRALSLRERLVAVGNSAEHRRDLSALLEQMGDVLAACGDAQRAEEHYARAIAIASELAAEDAHHSGYQQNLAFRLARRAVRSTATGDADGAIADYARAVEILEELADADADADTGAVQLELAICREGMATLLVDRNEIDAALNAYELSLPAWQRLITDDTTNPDYRWRMSSTLIETGRLLDRKGDKARAASYYDRALHALRRAIELAPGNAEYTRTLARLHLTIAASSEAAGDLDRAIEHHLAARQLQGGLGDSGTLSDQLSRFSALVGLISALRGRGDADGASRHLTELFAAAAQLPSNDPDRPDYPYGVIEGLRSAGELFGAKGQWDFALECYVRSADALAAHTPDGREKGESLRDMGARVAGCGRAQATAGAHAAALHCYRECDRITDGAIAADPNEVQHVHDKAVGLFKIGNLLAQRGEASDALETLVASLARFEEVVASAPTDTGYRRDLSAAHQNLADRLVAAEEFDRALGHRVQAIHLRRGLAELEPHVAEHHDALSTIFDDIVNTFLVQGNYRAAVSYHTQYVELRERSTNAEGPPTRSEMLAAYSHGIIADRLSDAGDATGALALYEETLTLLTGLVAAHPHDPEYRREKSIMHNRIGEVYIGLGDDGAALRHYTASAELRRELLAAEPNSPTRLLDVAMVAARISSLLQRRGDLAGALEQHRAVVTARARLAALQPDDDRGQRDLSLAHDDVALLHMEMGDVAGAVRHNQLSLEIAEALARRHPENTGYRRDVAVSHIAIGDVQRAAGDAPGAARAYSSALDVYRALHSSNPSSGDDSHGLAAALTRLGIVMSGGGPDELVAHYRRALPIREQLCAGRRSDPRYLRELRDDGVALAKLLAERGDVTGALGQFARSLLVCDQLVTIGDRVDLGSRGLTRLSMADAAERASDVDLTQAQLRAAAADFASGAADDADPNQSGFLYNLCATQYRLGRLLSQRGERDAAVATLTASVDTAVRVREIEPTAESRERLAMALNSLGRAVADRGDLAGALPHYQRCLQECEQLVDSEPENARYLDDLAIILDVLAGVLDRLRRRDEAIAHAVRAIAVNDRITVVDPTVKRFSELGLSYSRAAHYFKARRDFESALRHFTDALRIHEALADQFPQQPTHQIDVIHALDNLSAVEFSRDDHHAAGPYPERAFALATRLVDADPHSVEHHRELARRAYKCAVIRELLGDPTAREAYVASQRAFTWIDAAGMLTEQDGRELADVNRALSRGAGG